MRRATRMVMRRVMGACDEAGAEAGAEAGGEAGGDAGGGGSEQINGVNFVGRLLQDTPARELKSMADEMKQGLDNAVICLVATDSGKASIVVAVTDDLVATKSAVDLVRVGSAALGGGGGGGGGGESCTLSAFVSFNLLLNFST